MARSLEQELLHPPNPAELADLVAEDSFDDKSQPGTDVSHSGLRGKTQRRRGGSVKLTANAQTQPQQYSAPDGAGRCVSFHKAPPYLRREFILSGYYVGELTAR